MHRDAASLAQRALLLEVAATPTPGNVDRERDLPDLRFEQFQAGAVGARSGFDRLAADAPLGVGFERAVAGMADAAGTNTQFGALLLLAPLVHAASVEGGRVDGAELRPDRASGVAAATTVEDAADFYRAFDHVDVRVDEPPEGMEPLDVRRGSDAVPAVRERELTLHAVLEASAERDAIAREWVGGFGRTFDAADRLAALDGALADRAARVHLELLADEPDTLVAAKHDEAVAAEVRERAAALDPDDGAAVREFAAELLERGINPGATADLLAGALFVALVRGDVDCHAGVASAPIGGDGEVESR